MTSPSPMAVASAPGKLFIAGEYAVLSRGWCVVTATDRRVEGRVFDEAVGYHTDGAPLSEDVRLPRAAIAASPAAQRVELARLGADVQALYHGGEKLGLGSSAASTVALVAAMQAAASPGAPLDVDGIWRASLAAHLDIQGGRGSHADVAASAWGGWLAYRKAAPQAPFPALDRPELPGAQAVEGAHIVRLSWPESARVETIWTRAPARSVSLIRQVEGALIAHPDEALQTLELIAEVAEHLIAWMASPAPAACHGLDALAAGEAAMGRLGQLAGAPILTETHRLLSIHAQRLGCVAKPGGAGGGDLSLVAGPHDADWPALLADLPAGCMHVPMRLGQPGVSASCSRR